MPPSFSVGGGKSGAAFCVYVCMYIIHFMRWWKCYFPNPNWAAWGKKKNFLPPAAPHRNFPHFPHEMLFLCSTLELCIYLCWVFPPLLFGIPFKCCFEWRRKKFALELFCAWVLSIFPAMRYAIALPFRFPPKTVMDFRVGLDFRFAMTTLGFVFVYLFDGIFSFLFMFFYQFFRLRGNVFLFVGFRAFSVLFIMFMCSID